MITREQQIHNWLTIAVQQPAERLQEIFYFDKSEKEFFSILVVDYFLFDENFNIDKNTTSSYSIQNIEKLREKLRRIGKEDAEIIALPRLGVSKSDQEYLSEIDCFLNLNAINIEDATIWIPEDTGAITIRLKD